MKSFAQYLTESKKTYKFKVRVAGDLPEDFTNKMESCLQKYDVVNISNGKRAPITETPMDFPHLQNVEVTHYDIELNYTSTAHILSEYIASCCGCQNNHIVVRGENDPLDQIQKPADDSKPYESLLNTEDMGGESAQDQAGESRVMSLLKELETARKEREIDPMESAPKGDSKDISPEEYVKSPVGS